jgi:hypothetical protein
MYNVKNIDHLIWKPHFKCRIYNVSVVFCLFYIPIFKIISSLRKSLVLSLKMINENCIHRGISFVYLLTKCTCINLESIPFDCQTL